MAKKSQTYELKDGNKVVYIGETDNVARREQEHKDDGKTFTKLKPTSRPMKDENAKKREAEKLETFRRSHKNKNPKYNKTDDG